MHSPSAKKSVSKKSNLKSKSVAQKLLILEPNGEEYRTPLRRAPHGIWIYEIVDNGVVIYVGQTGNPKSRFYNHRNSGLAGKSAFMRLVEWCPDSIAAYDAEVRLIQAAQPVKNFAYNNRMPNDEAYAIWSDPKLNTAEKLRLMSG